MIRTTLLITALALGTVANAQQGQPGAHFIENWDANEDGQVTLAEATEKRSDIFYTFDEDDNGFLSASDYAMFDEARANDHASMKQGGQGQGQGQGKGRGHGQGQGGEGQGMSMAFNDSNNDGQVSRDEFMARTPDWFAMMDKNGDGVVTTDDFGRRG